MDDPKEERNNLSERLLGPDAEQTEDHLAGPGEIIVDPFQAAGIRGQSQTPAYRDCHFAVVFVVHLIVIVFLAFSWGTGSLKQEEDDGSYNPNSEDSVSLVGLLWLCSAASLVSIALSAISLDLMTRHSEQLIQTTLVISCTILGFLVFALFAIGATGIGFFCLFILLLSGLYAHAVWKRIPLAATNLRTALSAIQYNYGVCLLAYAVAFAANLWFLMWLLAFIGVHFKESVCEDGVCKSSWNPVSVVLMIISYHWTCQVLQNTLQVTIAGVVGTWWFAPQDANSIFSPAIQDSFRRATTYSFGSICMGSLLVAVLQTLRQFAQSARRQNQGGVLLCVLECILFYIERVALYFNKWAFIYVGLYGYDFLTAGKKVLNLFQERGWTTIISDNLVHRTLVLVCLVIAGLSGLVGMLLAKVTGWATAAFGEDANAQVFFICFLTGLSLSHILLGVVMSAVDTIIVSFAEAPVEFERNHPALSQQMVTAWRQVYPNECGF